MADVCIKANQVFSQCQQKDCPVITTTLTSLANIAGITFQNGSINGDITLTPILGKVDIYQAQFEVLIPYTISITGGVPFTANIISTQNIILYIPKSKTRADFPFEEEVETHTELLGNFYLDAGVVKFMIGTLIITRVIGEVQLKIAAIGYCDEPSDCEAYAPLDLCDLFKAEPFPTNFFPPFPKVGS